ncbi:hypothetical protein DKT69_01025 [Micromonospora sicca]|uniref:Uncharacterized protein n=1 Tax=Micromonospora sicca TaxID=2202420 RepID=A0A317DTT8_9ACTN|nr:hypothetical protein [Micromonospora sp. 4G51]PWR17286.1 hypothetical protein DKT69_01025 [Micromonospora sp. 4G51]
MIFTDARERLEHFRGDFPAKPMDARRIAGLLDAPGCPRRQVVDAASVPLKDLAKLIGCKPLAPSPFALQRGIRFEQNVISDAMTPLVPLVREHLGLDVRDVRQQLLSTPQARSQYPATRGVQAVTELRLRLTREAVAAMLDGEQHAINLLHHPYLELSLGDMPAYLEPDLLGYAAAQALSPIEIKSFPCIDGVADPVKTAEAARQTAVYVIALRRLVASFGHEPERVASRGLLVMARDFALTATASVLDLRPQVLRLNRLLNDFPHVTHLAPRVPTAISLPALPDKDANEQQQHDAAKQAKEAIGALDMRFGDGCPSCAMFDFCRGQARSENQVAQLGTEAANLCGDVGTVSHALALASGERAPLGSAESAVADELRRAALAVQLAGAPA